MSKTPPKWDVCDKKYVFDLSGPNGSALDAAAACPARGSDVLLASLTAKEAADDARSRRWRRRSPRVTPKSAATAQSTADEQAAEKARGQAIGGFFSGVFGGGNAKAAQPAPTGTTTVAPVPMPARTFG